MHSQCVYAISTNSARQRIILSFRGSITMNDWLTDAKMICGEIPNPLVAHRDHDDDNEDEDQPDKLTVHMGFRDYLYGNAPSILTEPLQKLKKQISETGGSKHSQDKKEKNKIETIMDQLKVIMEENPSYRLYITGHSLGGALSVLTSLEAAARFGERDRPVTCVAVANPRVGDAGFRAAIQTLERQGRLRCLVVHNHLDLVPLRPDNIFSGHCRHVRFVQQGVQLKLYKHEFDTYYHSGNETCLERTCSRLKHQIMILCCCVRMAEQHNYREYLNRLIAQKEELSKLFLHDLYRDESIEF